MTCALARGSEAVKLLSDAGFLGAWRDLRARCPWATAFQSPDFVETWYRIYGDVYEPVIIYQRGPEDRLDGLLALAVSRRENQWLVAGAAQAEYQAWLARSGRGDTFIKQAVTLLFDRCAVDRLQFLYLPSEAPLAWIDATGWRGRARLAQWHRPLMAVDDKEALSRSLAKKGNKSRLNRLKRLGELRLEEVTERTRLAEVIDRIADLCDFRHGAAHNVLPFRADSRKRDFHLALIETPGLLDVSLLWVGERLVGAHLGLRDRRILYNGILTHSPFEARHSPGKLHIMLLARRLAEEGFRFFDLTPGNDPWKDRFATDSETVHELVLHRRAGQCQGENRRIRGKQILGDMIRAVGPDPSQLRRQVAGLWNAGLPGMVSWIASRRRFGLYAGTGQALAAAPDQGRLCFDNLAHLSDHAAGREKVRLSDFLARSLERIEQGQTVCSAVSDGRLVFLAWILPAGSSVPRPPEWAAAENPQHCALVEIEAARSPDSQAGLLGSWIRQALRRALSDQRADSVLVKCPLDAARADQELRAQGLIRVGEGGQRRILGRDRFWVECAPLRSRAPVAPAPLVEAEGAAAGRIGKGVGS